MRWSRSGGPPFRHLFLPLQRWWSQQRGWLRPRRTTYCPPEGFSEEKGDIKRKLRGQAGNYVPLNVVEVKVCSIQINPVGSTHRVGAECLAYLRSGNFSDSIHIHHAIRHRFIGHVYRTDIKLVMLQIRESHNARPNQTISVGGFFLNFSLPKTVSLLPLTVAHLSPPLACGRCLSSEDSDQHSLSSRGRFLDSRGKSLDGMPTWTIVSGVTPEG